MALVTVDAVVDVSWDVGVAEISRVVPAVADRALEYSVIIRIDMAGGANVVRVAMSGWKLRVLGVIERCIRPGARVVAVLTRRREELRLRRMAGVCAVGVIRLMTSKTGSWQGRVVVVYVTV